MKNIHSYVAADWPAPSNIKAFATTRLNGVSQTKFATFNLADHVGDELDKVESNRQQLSHDLHLPAQPYWLNQVHGTQCVEVQNNQCVEVQNNQTALNADAAFTVHAKQVCVVMTADCLPILFCNKQGDWVAACHAGWRGLAAGVIQNTVAKYLASSADLIAWIGPAITQPYFEVGDDVFEQFVALKLTNEMFFQKKLNQRFQFDLIGLAKNELNLLGVKVFGGSRCSFAEEKHFYSYRREGKTGRMASLVWME